MSSRPLEYNAANVFTILETVKTKLSNEVESDTIEFKEYSSGKSLHNDSELPGEISALANWRGGVLIVGVRDGTNIGNDPCLTQLVGFSAVDADTTLERIKGRLQNSVDLRVENIGFESKNYLAIFIRKQRNSIVMTTSGKAYVREGKASRPMTPEEVEHAVKSLQNYDWSSDFIADATDDDFSEADTASALDRYCQFRGLVQRPSTSGFLEAIEAKKNGLVTKGGLLFLGKLESIRKFVGDIEFRFSWKEGVVLKKNEIWSGNLWHSIVRAKTYFGDCVIDVELSYKGNAFTVKNLDPDAFHEAFLNAVAHRDYSIDGMVSVEFSGSQLQITSPGQFYGGVNSDNIFVHDPRHRNKALARMLMEYKFVDRAGMGIVRMGVKSLIYGRSSPSFEEHKNSVRVTMEAEYIRPGIFVLTRDRKELYVPDLLILNALYEKGSISTLEVINLIRKVAGDPWEATDKFLERWGQFVEAIGTKEAINVAVKEDAKELFKVQKLLKVPQNSQKYVTLFYYLKKNGTATNEEISELLEYSHSSTTSRFLTDIDWVERTGNRGTASRWGLIRKYL